MAINEWKVLQKLRIFKKPPEPPKIDVDKDIDAVLLSLKEISPVVKELPALLKQFRFLRNKELTLRKTKPAGNEIRNIIEQEVEVFDKILKHYEYFVLDVDINGERVKNISTVLGKSAKDAMISQRWLNRIKKSERWIFDW